MKKDFKWRSRLTINACLTCMHLSSLMPFTLTSNLFSVLRDDVIHKLITYAIKEPNVEDTSFDQKKAYK